MMSNTCQTGTMPVWQDIRLQLKALKPTCLALDIIAVTSFSKVFITLQTLNLSGLNMVMHILYRMCSTSVSLIYLFALYRHTKSVRFATIDVVLVQSLHEPQS